MTDGDQPSSPSHGDPGHDDSMEHPVIFFETLVSDSPIFTLIHDALTREAGDDPSRMEAYDEQLRKLIDEGKTLDWLADRARRAVFGDIEAQAMLIAWLDCRPAAPSEPHDREHANHTHHAFVHDDAVLEFLLAPLVDVLMGTAYGSYDNPHGLQRRVATIQVVFERLVSSLGFLHRVAQRHLQGIEPADSLSFAFDELNKGHDLICTPPRVCGSLHAHTPTHHESSETEPAPHDPLATLFATWASENPVSLWLKYSSEQRNNSSLVRLSPVTIRGEGDVTLFAKPANPFDASQSQQIGVFSGPSGVAAKVVRWGATEITIQIPEHSESGCVYFARTLTEQETNDVELSLHELAMLVGAHWHRCFLSHHSPPEFVRPPHCFEDDRNCVRVLHKPRIVDFAAYDAKGRMVSGAVDAGAAITLKWTIISDDPASLQVSISSNGRPAHTELSASGSVRVVVLEEQAFTLHATDSIDATSLPPIVVSPQKSLLRLRPRRLTLYEDTFDVLHIELAYANPEADVLITLTSSDETKVKILSGSTITIPAGVTRTFVVVAGADTGHHPGQPAATITASAPAYGSASVDVWLANPTGQWKELDTALDLVPVHAAILTNGKVLFFSWDENDYKDVKRGKSQVWDPESEQPAPLLKLSRNLFCSGHCLLPDGRLMVAGGKDGGSYIVIPFGNLILHQGPDRDLHTVRVDDDQPSGVSWDSHESFREARWYPTCVTLADGTALTVGGSRSGSGQAHINNTYEIFEPISGEKSDPRQFGKDVKVYPFLMVLPDGSPEGTLFVHRNHHTYLRRLASNTWIDKTFHTNLRKSRTYNRQGSCVLLPIRPNESARLLVIGGDGGDDRATNTAEIFEFNPAVPKSSKWRPTTSLKFKRFLSDAILLPDGTVLVVNGAAKGSADESKDSVKTAELFNPATESWDTLAPAQHSRHYHSVGILLPDARVLVGGNTRPYNPGNPIDDRTIELFSPPYLFRGPQPVITWVPERVGHDERILIVSPDAAYPDREDDRANPSWITSVALVRSSSVTHSNNMDQRCVESPIIGRDSSSLIVKSPADGTVAPPGYYMVFILNRNGVPSKAKLLRIG
jgi:Domain of unknown function (DUF1929)/Glyoxal oxidase N-terminus